MPMTDAKFIDVYGIKTRYFEQGKGEPLVLWHGSHFGTEDACEALDVRGYVRPPGQCERGAIDHSATPDEEVAIVRQGIHEDLVNIR